MTKWALYVKISLLACFTMIIPNAVMAEECSINLSEINQWTSAEESKSDSDRFVSNNGELYYYDKGGIITDSNTEESGYTLYHDFDTPVSGDVYIKFKVKCDRSPDFQGISFLSTKINGSYVNSRVSPSNTRIMRCEFSNRLRNITGDRDAVIPEYNYIDGYWYSYDVTLHLTGSTIGNTADISIKNDAVDGNKLNVSFKDVQINGGGVLGSIVINSADRRKQTLQSEMHIKDFTVTFNKAPDENDNKITIKLDGSKRQRFNGLGVNAGSAFEIHSDEAVRDEMLDKIFNDLDVDKLRIWVNVGIYMQKDENGNIVYDLDAANPYIRDTRFNMLEGFWYNYERAKDYGMMSINDIIDKYNINEVLLAPGGLSGDNYKVPAWMRGNVEDPYTGEILSDMLLPENAPVYGEALARLIYDVRDKYNVKITAATIFNELGGCITDREILTIIKTLRNKLDEYGLNYVKILAPEYSTNSLSRLSRFMNYIKQDPEAYDIIFGFANHSYSCGTGRAEEEFILESSKPLWMTEICEEGELTGGGYSECAHTAGIFLSDLNHMVSDWYYFIAANAVHENRLFTVGGTLMYSTYSGTSNIIPPEERKYHAGYTQRPIYAYLKQTVDAIPKGTVMTKCISNREGDMELSDINDNKLYAAAGENPDGGISIALLNNTSTEKQLIEFNANNSSRVFADEVITVDVDLSEYDINENIEFNVISTSPDGEIVDMGKITAHDSKLSISVRPAELITLVSSGAVKSMYSAGINKQTHNVFVEGVLKQPFNKDTEINIMLAKKDSDGNVSDIAYVNSTYPDDYGRYSMKFSLPEYMCEEGRLNGYKLYAYHNSNNLVNDYILKVESGGILDVDYNTFNSGKLNADITNPYGNNEAYKIIVGFYDINGRLISCQMSEEKDISYESFTKESGSNEQISYEAPAGTVKIKAFVFGRGSAMTPMDECVQTMY
ncbi:MAG: hypothetical protein J6N52_03045 [Clostridia bacterium]|nr:hypothetical protein [Clostridia bacterium]